MTRPAWWVCSHPDCDRVPPGPGWTAAYPPGRAPDLRCPDHPRSS